MWLLFLGLLLLVFIDEHAWEFTNSVSGQYKLVERPGESHEGVGRKKKLAARAQKLAIHCHHFSSLNAALYILSQGPWIPTHISVHVRQATLAAVGVGWSCVNQVPTVFPFSHFDASLSLATLEDVPTNQVAQVGAMFAIYATLCGNLTQSTRNFLFSKYEVQCGCCAWQIKYQWIISVQLCRPLLPLRNFYIELLQSGILKKLKNDNYSMPVR